MKLEEREGGLRSKAKLVIITPSTARHWVRVEGDHYTLIIIDRNTIKPHYYPPYPHPSSPERERHSQADVPVLWLWLWPNEMKHAVWWMDGWMNNMGCRFVFWHNHHPPSSSVILECVTWKRRN